MGYILMDPRKQELQKLKALISEDPNYIKEVLEVTVGGLEEYKRKCQCDRNDLAWNAINDLLSLLMEYKKIDKIKPVKSKQWFCINTISVLLYKYPEGYEHNTYSKNDLLLLDTFCTYYFDEKVELHGSMWEADVIKIKEYIPMLYKQWLKRSKQLKGE